MPTEFVSIIAASDPGGYDAHYTSLNLWDSGRRGDITSAGSDTIEIAEIDAGYASAVLTNGVQFSSSNWTTDDTNYIIIRSTPAGKYDGTGAVDLTKSYIERDGGGTNTYVVRPEGIKIVFRDLQILHTNSLNGSHCLFTFTGNSEYIIENCLIRNEADSALSAGGYEGACVEWRSPGAECVMRNTIMQLVSANAVGGTAWYCQNANNGVQNFVFQNVTCVVTNTTSTSVLATSIRDGCTTEHENCYYAVPATSTQPTINATNGSTTTIGTGVATSDAEATTASLQNIPFSTATFESVTDGSEDFTPASGSALIDAGVDLAKSGVTDDLLGTSRPQGIGFDIGAIELPQASVGGGPNAPAHLLRHDNDPTLKIIME